MAYWQDSLVPTIIVLALLLGIGLVVERFVAIPPAILGGVIGLIFGPGALALLPMDIDALESGVYHALAIVFISLALKRQPPSTKGGGARSMAFGITTMVGMQTCIGLTLAMVLGVHPGFGLLLPLAFEQGPGQALSLGAAWESSGLTDGAQIGLILAAIGFGWAIVAGVPLVAWGKRQGWDAPTEADDDAVEAEDAAVTGGLAPVIAAVGFTYALTWVVCWGLSTALASLPDIAAMVWGFHFLIGSLLAMPVRKLIDAMGAGDALDDGLLSRTSGATVDVATVAALSAVKIAVLTAFWLPIVVISTVGGLATLMACVFLGRRGFARAPFEHLVLWFGMSTGTLPLGMTLLRSVDPQLKSPAPTSAVLGSALAIVGVGPIVLGLHPLAIAGSPALALGGAVAWLALTLGGWAWLGGLRLAPPGRTGATQTPS